MPSRYVRKTYTAGGVYHAYNRGVEQRPIFLDDQDYRVFLNCLKYYLSPPPPPDPTAIESQNQVAPKSINLAKEVDLLAFVLMPNHFHLELRQKTADGMSKLLQQVGTRFSLYFNKRHQRRGTLFEGPYKAVELEGPREILYVSYYIHRNPDPKGFVLGGEGLALDKARPSKYRYTSLPYFLGQKQAVWVKPQKVLEQLEKIHPPLSSYQDFISSQIKDLPEVVRDKILE